MKRNAIRASFLAVELLRRAALPPAAEVDYTIGPPPHSHTGSCESLPGVIAAHSATPVACCAYTKFPSGALWRVHVTGNKQAAPTAWRQATTTPCMHARSMAS